MSCNEWKNVKIDDICDIRRGASPRPIIKYVAEKGIPWVKIADATSANSRYISNTKEYICEEGKDKSVFIKKGDLILSNSATPGIPKFMGIDACIHDGWLLLNNFKQCNKMFLYYKLVNDREKLLCNANGSVFKNLKTDIVKNHIIKLPPLEEQEKIATILSCLDDKIELNNEMNKTLEEMAQSIFKRWFVDFEFPNEDGEPYKSSGGEMVDSELGMIPKGWEVKKISELIEVKDGTHASPKVSKEGFPLVTSKHIKGDRIAIEDAKIISEKDYLEVNKRSKVDTGDILISMIGTVGLTYFVQEEEINFAIKNIGLFKTSQNKTLSEYFYLYLKSDNMKNYIEARLAGTTQKYISLGELRNIPVVLPNDSIIDKFKKVVGVLLDKRRLNIINNEELMITRDTLLPKLMNGEIMI